MKQLSQSQDEGLETPSPLESGIKSGAQGLRPMSGAARFSVDWSLQGFFRSLRLKNCESIKIASYGSARLLCPIVGKIVCDACDAEPANRLRSSSGRPGLPDISLWAGGEPGAHTACKKYATS